MAAASFFSSVATGLLKDAPRRETELKEAAKALESTWKVGRVEICKLSMISCVGYDV